MKKLFFPIVLVIIVSLFGCGTGNQLAIKKETAQMSYNSGDYTTALAAFSEIVTVYEENNNSEECPVYTPAGESAFKTGNTKLAINYLKKGSNTDFRNESTYYYLAQAYNKIDNLSLEIMALHDYIEKYPTGKEINAVKTRLFFTSMESDNIDEALKLWPEVYANSKDSTELLEAYFSINKNLNNIDSCNNIADQLLELNPDNIVSLSWYGKQYYRKAEDRYQKEMKAYDRKKTNKQYRILLKALDAVTANFKKSLTYFDKLYSIDPSPENANYLSHIYGRLSDKKKEAYYKNLAKK